MPVNRTYPVGVKQKTAFSAGIEHSFFWGGGMTKWSNGLKGEFTNFHQGPWRFLLMIRTQRTRPRTFGLYLTPSSSNEKEIDKGDLRYNEMGTFCPVLFRHLQESGR